MPNVPGVQATLTVETTEALLAAAEVLAALASRSLTAVSDEVTESQYRLLVVLDAGGPRTMSALATALGVRPSSVTRACDRLVDKHLIRRSSDADDRRAVRIELADRGRWIVREVMRRRRDTIDQILRSLGATRQRAIAVALRQFNAAATVVNGMEGVPAGDA